MEGAAVKNIADLAQRKPVEVNGFILRPDDWVPHDPNELIKLAPKAPTFAVATLGALRDYLNFNRDGLDLAKIVVHVETPFRVAVGGQLRERSRDREIFIVAQATDLLDGFLGKFMELEAFNIGLQMRFCDADQRRDLQLLVSNVKNESVATAMDDGISQTVEARAGTVMVQATKVPNPVQLTGFRTFRDIPQPSSHYVLRAQAGPLMALFEADGGSWKLSTIGKIRDWLVDNLPAGVAVLA